MKTIAILIFVSFSFTLAAMEQTSRKRRSELDKPHPKKRRSEIEALLTEKHYKCEVDECFFINTLRAVTEHERRKHGIYKNKKVPNPETPTPKPALFLCEFPSCKFYGLFEEVEAHEKEHKNDGDTPVKKLLPLGAAESLSKPIPRIQETTAELFHAWDSKLCEREKKELAKKEMREQEERKKLATINARKCSLCLQSFSQKVDYINHVQLKHGYTFPIHEINGANIKKHMILAPLLPK